MFYVESVNEAVKDWQRKGKALEIYARAATCKHEDIIAGVTTDRSLWKHPCLSK